MEKRQKLRWLTIFSVALAMGGATYLSYLLNPSNERDPAAISNSYKYDFSTLRGRDLKVESAKALIEEARVMKVAERFGVVLGNFLITDEEGKKRSACSVYDRVQLEFTAEGMAISGSRPKMEITAYCEEGRNKNRLQTLWIPYRDFLKEEPGEFEVTMNQEMKTHFRFVDLSLEWPDQWVLSKVRLYNDADSSQQILVDQENINRLSGAPVSMLWME